MLSRPVKDGKTKTTQRQHLEQVWKSTGKKPKRLADIVKPDSDIIYLWEWYSKLAAGSDRLSYTEILSWSTLTGLKLHAMEVDILKQLDRIYWSAHNHE